MKLILAITALFVMTLPALAWGDDEACRKADDGLWICKAPAKAPTCKYFEGKLLCNAPVSESVKPSNCSWVKDKYVCS